MSVVVIGIPAPDPQQSAPEGMSSQYAVHVRRATDCRSGAPWGPQIRRGSTVVPLRGEGRRPDRPPRYRATPARPAGHLLYDWPPDANILEPQRRLSAALQVRNQQPRPAHCPHRAWSVGAGSAPSRHEKRHSHPRGRPGRRCASPIPVSGALLGTTQVPAELVETAVTSASLHEPAEHGTVCRSGPSPDLEEPGHPTQIEK